MPPAMGPRGPQGSHPHLPCFQRKKTGRAVPAPGHVREQPSGSSESGLGGAVGQGPWQLPPAEPEARHQAVQKSLLLSLAPPPGCLSRSREQDGRQVEAHPSFSLPPTSLLTLTVGQGLSLCAQTEILPQDLFTPRLQAAPKTHLKSELSASGVAESRISGSQRPSSEHTRAHVLGLSVTPPPGSLPDDTWAAPGPTAPPVRACGP